MQFIRILALLALTLPMAWGQVAISALPDAANANATDQIPANQGGTTRRITVAEVTTVVLASIDTFAELQGVVADETLLAESSIDTSAELLAIVADATGTGAAVFADSPTLVTPDLGTPSAGVLTNATGLPIGTGVAGLGTGVADFLGTPSSANFATAVTGETGSGALVFGTAPTLGAPVIADFTSAAHDHGDADDGGVLVVGAISALIDTFSELDTIVADAVLASSDSTNTLTNKTLDAEGTGNVLTVPFWVQLPPVGCSGTSGTLLWDTNASLAPTAVCSEGTTNALMMRGTANFPDSDGDYSIQQQWLLPPDFSGTVDAYIRWNTAATTGDVVWQVQTACVADAEVNDAAWNTASTVTDTAKGTTLQSNAASITGVTITGCAASEIFHIRVLRNRTHASDTITGVVSLSQVALMFRRAM